MKKTVDPSDINSLLAEMEAETHRGDELITETKCGNLLQSKIFEIWAKMLGFSSFGFSDDLFDVGGDSITAIQIFSEINKEFSVRLPMEELFMAESFSIAWLSALVERHLMEMLGKAEFDSLMEEVDGLSNQEVKQQLEAD